MKRNHARDLSSFILDVEAVGCFRSQLWLRDVCRAGHAEKDEAIHHAVCTGLILITPPLVPHIDSKTKCVEVGDFWTS